jgi:dihydroorotate dehydrogenase
MGEFGVSVPMSGNANRLADSIWDRVVRPILFRLEPEHAHHLSMSLFTRLARIPFVRRLITRAFRVEDERLRVRRFGLEFPNPVGLAAGFDKNAEWFNDLSALGFGFIEVGTLTAQPQAGNPKPRVFRLTRDRALLNRLGFNNRGATAAARELARRRVQPILGVNIGKSATVPLASATSDYLASFDRLYDHAAYFAINVSSPNTPGLRDLQTSGPLSEILRMLTDRNRALATQSGVRPRPILVKVAPDLNERDLESVLGVCQDHGVDGIIVANTSVGRDGLSGSRGLVHRLGEGGLSGAPLTRRTRALVSYVFRQTSGRLPIIGVGGVMTGEDAWQLIRAGASLIQVYTGFIYGGPGFVASVNRHLVKRLRESGKQSIEEVIGEAHLVQSGTRAALPG